MPNFILLRLRSLGRREADLTPGALAEAVRGPAPREESAGGVWAGRGEGCGQRGLVSPQGSWDR